MEILKFDDEFEIEKEFPHRIRRIGKNIFVKEWKSDKGYIKVCLNKKSFFKHRLIALQWIENDAPDTKTQIDHINQIKTDNRIENLRWCTQSENMKNINPLRKESEYLDELPESVFEINEYHDFLFEDYYFDYESERILKHTKTGKIKIINPGIYDRRIEIGLSDIFGKRRTFSYNKFIKTIREAVIQNED